MFAKGETDCFNISLILWRHVVSVGSEYFLLPVLDLHSLLDKRPQNTVDGNSYLHVDKLSPYAVSVYYSLLISFSMSRTVLRVGA